MNSLDENRTWQSDRRASSSESIGSAEPIDSELLALRSLCQVLFSSNEFIYVR